MEDYYVQQSKEYRFTDLNLIFCGREACESLHSFGPVVRPHYILHYILEGKGIFQAGGETWQLQEKQGFLIEPEELTFYQADQENPWTYCWIGFDGSLAPVLLRELGLSRERPVFCCDQKEAMEDVFLTIFRHQKYSEVNDLILQSQLYRFFAILMENCRIPDRTQGVQKNDYVQAAERYIRNHYFMPVHVQDAADYAGINRSYLYTLFLAETGMSPSEYLTRYRLTRAAQLLRLTSYPIERIALSCGYQDPVVFTKAFRKEYGVTPRRFRLAETDQDNQEDVENF